MSFEDIWQENKSYIVSLVGGLVVFGTSYYFITDHYERAVMQNAAAARSAQSRANSAQLPPGRVDAVTSELNELDARLSTLETEYAYKPGPGFTLAGATKAADVHFNETVGRLVTEVVEAALSRDIRIPQDLGLNGVTPRSNGEREWYLNALDVVNRVAVAGLASNIRSIDRITIPPLPPPPRERTAQEPYTKAVPVTFSIVGHPRAVDGVLRSLSLPGQRLAVDSATITTLDEDNAKNRSSGGEQTVRLDVVVKAMRLNKDGEPQRVKSPRY